MKQDTKDRLEKLAGLGDYDAKDALARSDMRACRLQGTRSEIVDSDDERAVLRAWLGDISLGGWMSDDEDIFLAALRDELAYVGTGERTLDSVVTEIEIEKVS